MCDKESYNSYVFCVEIRGPVMAPPIGEYPLTLKKGGPWPNSDADSY